MRPLTACFVLIAAALTTRAGGDALVFTQAMKATTIAEVFVGEGAIRVEFEIGLPDLDGFRNLMPDEVYERLGYGPRPIAERLPRFFAEDWIIRADGGDPLPGRIESIEPRPRVRRDEITGEPLPAAGDEETVVAVTITYALPERPATVSFSPPRGEDGLLRASVGFVVFHEGLPVNDFRYLGQEETLDLDWDDPWYSRFRNRNLRRQYDAPLSGFLYVDHFEVRKEFIVRPKDLESWIDLGIEGDVIRAEDQVAMKERVAAFLAGRCRVVVDGRTIEPVLDRIHFVRRTLRTTGVVDPPEDLPVISATLGVIFVYPIQGLPDEVAMTWDLFSDRIASVPTVATDEAGGLPYTVAPDDPVLVWKNFLKNPSRPGLVDVPVPRPPARLPIPVASIVLGAGALLAGLRSLRSTRLGSRRMPIFAIILAAGAIALWPFARLHAPLPFAPEGKINDGDAEVVVQALLENVYRAFDYRDESVIYDTLERSASGDLLADVYLETRRSLELENQGGARAKVTDVEMLGSETTALDDGPGFRSTCTWNVAGAVGHWGHIHQRRNQYEAIVTVRPVDGTWRITDLELVSEQRL